MDDAAGERRRLERPRDTGDGERDAAEMPRNIRASILFHRSSSPLKHRHDYDAERKLCPPMRRREKGRVSVTLLGVGFSEPRDALILERWERQKGISVNKKFSDGLLYHLIILEVTILSSNMFVRLLFYHVEQLKIFFIICVCKW